jgi:diguanylate cyclase (GGDEF)-like protein/PAS domain S-box-containing protein
MFYGTLSLDRRWLVSQIIVERAEGSLLDRFSAYRVIIDGVYRGSVRQKEKWSFTVSAGAHNVVLRTTYSSSPPVKVSVANRTRLMCRSSLAHALGLLAVVSPRPWISVHEDENPEATEMPYPGDVDWQKMANVAAGPLGSRWRKKAAKSDLPGALRLSDRKMDEATRAKRSLELDLREAVTTGALELRYEPQVDLATRRVIAFEALLRWRHPVLGKVPASDFIPLAESLGLIGAIGQQVLERACHEATTWPEDVNVSVNISPGQLRDGALAVVVASALRRSGLAPERLTLELAEGVAMRGATLQTAELEALREIGVRVAVDDFGISLASLRTGGHAPVDLIKVHRLLVSGLCESKDQLANVRATIDYCASLRIPCCAVGVESEEELAILVREQCAQAQGYVFGPSLAAREVPALLARMNPSRSCAVSASNCTSTIPFADIVESANDIVIVTTADLQSPGPIIVYVNPAFTRLTGFAAQDAIGRSPRILQGPGTSRATLDAIRAGLEQGRMVTAQILNYARSGAPYWLDMRISPIHDESGTIRYFAAIERDVTMDRRRLDELDCVSERDTLTGIPVRRTLLRVVEAEIGAMLAGIDVANSPCVAVIRVDGLARITSVMGQAAVDALLVGIADRMADNIRRIDLIARTDFAEFAVVMPNVRLREAKTLILRLRNAVASMPFATLNGPTTATVSVGVVEFEKGNTAPVLLERAESALNSAHVGLALDELAL